MKSVGKPRRAWTQSRLALLGVDHTGQKLECGCERAAPPCLLVVSALLVNIAVAAITSARKSCRPLHAASILLFCHCSLRLHQRVAFHLDDIMR